MYQEVEKRKRNQYLGGKKQLKGDLDRLGIKVLGLPVVRKYGRTYQSPCPQSRIRTAVAISEIGAEEGGGKRERGKLEKERKGRKERGKLEKERRGRKERGRLVLGLFTSSANWYCRTASDGR